MKILLLLIVTIPTIWFIVETIRTQIKLNYYHKEVTKHCIYTDDDDLLEWDR